MIIRIRFASHYRVTKKKLLKKKKSQRKRESSCLSRSKAKSSKKNMKKCVVCSGKWKKENVEKFPKKRGKEEKKIWKTGVIYVNCDALLRSWIQYQRNKICDSEEKKYIVFMKVLSQHQWNEMRRKKWSEEKKLEKQYYSWRRTKNKEEEGKKASEGNFINYSAQKKKLL